MKKVFASALLLTLSLACTGLASAAISVSSQPFGNVAVHTVSSSEGLNAVVVENAKLVLFDSISGGEDAQAYQEFVASLNKPVDRIFLSHAHDHHFAGLAEMFPNVPVFSVDAVAINEVMPLNVQPLADGKITVDGVEYEFVTYSDLGAWVIKLPAEKVAMVHHLGYIGLHLPMPPLEARLNVLRGLESEGYVWFIGGHGQAPLGQEFVQGLADYFAVVVEAVVANSDPQAAKAVIVAKYPDWAGVELLEMLLPMLYQ